MPLFADFKGKFITFEGIEGVGKSTNIKFVAKLLKNLGIEILMTREPGGTPMGEDIRRTVLAHQEEEVLAETEALLLFAARAQHVHNVIKPALAAGKCVLCDRFTDASYAYQGGGRGISSKFIGSLEQMTQGDLRPDATLLLDLPVDIGLSRAKGRGEADRFEVEELKFFERVREAYLVLAKQNKQRYKVVDASQSLEQVQMELKKLFVN